MIFVYADSLNNGSIAFSLLFSSVSKIFPSLLLSITSPISSISIPAFLKILIISPQFSGGTKSISESRETPR
ncbi:MAG: hypothetical protein AUK59_04250 [Candidatus Altarchaeum sp. CG2_30_32_3053]|nr:MAG: hypothetical protein AUK59_04250 [Candidatus Altarchaeum sp. CG2_30_32_3053]